MSRERPLGARRSIRGALALLASVLLGAGVLAACEGSDEPESALSKTLVGGEVCGLFDPDLVTSLIGHDNVAVRGSGIASAAKRTSDTIDCEVIDDDRVKTSVLVVVAEQPEARRADAAAMLATELASKSGCSQPASVTDLGDGYVCTMADNTVQLNVLLAKRLVRLTYKPGPEATGDPVESAVQLVKDVDANIDAYDAAQ